MLTHPKFAIATTLVWATLVAVLISAGSMYATAQTEGPSAHLPKHQQI